MANAWVEHIRKFAKDNNITYGCALSTPECKNSYVKVGPTPKTKTKKKTICKKDCETCDTCKIENKPYKKYDKAIGPEDPKKKKVNELLNFVDTFDLEKELAKVKKYDKPKLKQEINIMKNEQFIDDIEKTLSSKSTRNIRSFKKKYENVELLNDIFDAQEYSDFYPTPQKCLQLFDDNIEYIEKDEHILEPSAGLGSIVHYLQKKGYKNIEANELNSSMAAFIKKNYNVNTTQADFLNKNYDNNDFSLIFCNPPFSLGNNKTFYIDFLFKCCDVLRKSKITYEKVIYFISPPLTKKKNDTFSGYEVWDNLSKNKKSELSKKYKIRDDDDASEFLPNQILRIGECSGFAGTNTSAEMYAMIVY